MLSSTLVQPYRGELVSPMAAPARQQELKAASEGWPSWDLTPPQLADLELLLSGALSPLDGYLGRAAYDRVLAEMQLTDGTFWPWPVTLDVTADFAGKLSEGDSVALRDPEGVMLAALYLTDIWCPDREAEADVLCGTRDPTHPGAAMLLEPPHPVYLAGKLEGLQLPVRYDFRMLRNTPGEIRDQLQKRGWGRVLACETDGVIHRAQHEQILRVAREHETNTLLFPAVGLADPSDRRYFSRIRCVQATLPHFPRNSVLLSLLPNHRRHGGVRELLLRAIVHQNYGCSHTLCHGDNGSGVEALSESPPSASTAEHLERFEPHLGIRFVRAERLVYVKELMDFYLADELPEEAFPLRFGEADLAARLDEGRPVPEWYSFPEVVTELRRTYLPRSKKGFTVLFSGLSGAGKSTIANVLLVRLLEIGGRPVTLLDGDIVRKNLSSELTFSREHRDLNIRRIGFVASKITKNGGIAICAPIAPYRSVRQEVRDMIAEEGGFVLVHVATPVEVCEQRDRKGIYAKARAGIIKNFTGISDPYEEPQHADVVIDTTDRTPVHCAQQVLLYLKKQGYLGPEGDDTV